MNKTIWKFPLTSADIQPIWVPEGAEVLTLQLQNDQPYLWALVNPEREKEERVFEIHGTGNPIYCDMGIDRKYIGTYQVPPYVWHVFERLS